MEDTLMKRRPCGVFDGYLCMDAGDVLVEKLPGPDPGRFLQMLLERGVAGPDENE